MANQRYKRLWLAMVDMGMSVKELSGQIFPESQSGYQMMQNRLNGRTSFTVDEALKVAEVMNTSVESLFGNGD